RFTRTPPSCNASPRAPRSFRDASGLPPDGRQSVRSHWRAGTQRAPRLERGERTTMGDIAAFETPVRHPGLHPGRSVRAFWSLVPILSSVLALGVGIARAADNPTRDPRGSHTITVIDPGLLLPGSLTIRQGEALEFANYTSDAIRLVFVEPEESAEDVRCRV